MSQDSFSAAMGPLSTFRGQFHKSLCIECKRRSTSRVSFGRIRHGVELGAVKVEAIHQDDHRFVTDPIKQDAAERYWRNFRQFDVSRIDLNTPLQSSLTVTRIVSLMH